ncbi:hypothetical protein [Cerasicoccus fimbriatus]|uniref:hypothetical protein n=1 Tax=Cerasicoccus fimbriatus TaxID=3014554 RepID=UPI0022B2C7B0|nr:hypothetical protein [Cerasicoccus sp. TK19100]
MKLTIPFAILAATTAAAQVQIVTYDFDGGAAAPTTITSNANALDFEVITDPAGRGAISSSSDAAYIFVNATGSTQAEALDGDSYFTFTVNADPGFQLDLSSVGFNYGMYKNAGGAIAYNVYLQSSVDGFGSTQAILFSEGNTIVENSTQTISSGAISLSAPEYQGLSSITFRISYSDDTNSTNSNNVRVDNVVLNGNVSVIPEPGHYAAGLGAMALLGLCWIKRRR